MDLLRQRIAQLHLEERVRLLGEVDGAAAVLKDWDMVVLPSRREGFGLVLVEAMAAGRPLVATRAGGIPEVVEDGETGILVPVEDAGALAAALQRLAGDPGERLRLGQRGRQLAVQRFSAEATARAWASVPLMGQVGAA